jgi:hypothetical protein
MASFGCTEERWRKIYTSPGAIALCMSPEWLRNGCPKCGCTSWQVTNDCWAYCDGCYKSFPTLYAFTSEPLAQLSLGEQMFEGDDG